MTDDSAKNRDLYLQYMRLENPEYELMSKEEVRMLVAAAPPLRVKKPNPAKPPCGYKCSTQTHSGTAEIYLGINRGTLSLWESNSVINWTARFDGYPSFTQRDEAIVGFWRACNTWNRVMQDRVRFNYVGNLSDAAIELRYDDSGREGLLASAFFPDTGNLDLNFVRVYESQFDPRYKARNPIYNTMLHEIGHVLGLRHEFAHDREGFAESILFGIKNPRSVMAYYPAQEIQDTDVEAVRRAYDELADGSELEGQGPFGTIRKVVNRVEPNN